MSSYGYLRVSTGSQDLEKNKAAILRYVNDLKLGEHVEFIEEVCSGKVSWKDRKLKNLFDSMSEGDNLVVSEMSRIGRSMLDVMQILSLATERGINIYAVKGNWKLDDSIQSKVLAFAFTLAAEVERELISQRTKESLRVLKDKGYGYKLGRPRGPGKSKLDKHEPEIIALLKNHSSITYVASRFDSSPATLYNWLKKRGLNRFGVKMVGAHGTD